MHPPADSPSPFWSAVVGRNVRKFRRQLKLTQRSLASSADVDLSYLGKVERGEVNPTLSVLVRIAEVLETKPATLLSDDNEFVS